MSDDRAVRQDWLTRNIQTKLSPDEQEALAASLELLKRFVED